jgi:hypothetical protein
VSHLRAAAAISREFSAIHVCHAIARRMPPADFVAAIEGISDALVGSDVMVARAFQMRVAVFG